MEDNNKVIMAICAVVLFLVISIMTVRGCVQSKQAKRIEMAREAQRQSQDRYKDLEKEAEGYSYGSHSSRSSYTGSYSSSSSSQSDDSDILYANNDDGNPPSLLTEEDKKRLEERMRKNDEDIARISQEIAEEMINDPKYGKKTVEQLKIRTNPTYIRGSIAFKEKNYKVAITEFNKLAQNSNEAPVTRYFALTKIMDVALEMRDSKLYFLAARMKAGLVATEDLTAVGIEEKTQHDMEWIEFLENTLAATKDKKALEKCIKLKMQELQTDNISVATKAVEKDMAFYSEKYKELLE